MPNVLDANGLQTSTRQELVDYFTAQYQLIYGSDINLASNTPDGQMMNIFIQTVLDLQDLLVAIYNSFDPDNAVGVTLDQRCAQNGIQRQGGTYTITPITVVNSQSVNLYGLDQDEQEVYTVADNAGNRWFLQETQLGLAAGTHSLSFRAEDPGAQLTIPNTITVPVTIVLGVTSVNNPTTYTTLGENEESDAALKIRRQQSVALSSQGYLQGLLAALENISGVTSAFVYENNTDATDSDGVPSHSIWVIIAGAPDNALVADAIYTKRNAGCGMYGETDYTITQIDGSPFIVSWDTVLNANLFIAFTVTSIDGVTQPDIAAIKAGIVASYTPDVYEEVNINGLATIVQQYDDNTLVTNAGFSQGTTQVLTLSGVPASGTFRLQYGDELSAAISWNDSISTIQTKLQATTGLASATVTGSLASQSLTFDLSALDDVDALLAVSFNTLQTSAPAAITFSYNEDYANTLQPSTKRKQFIVSAANVVILPMQLQAAASSVAALGTVQLTGLGGYGTLTYSLQTNNSGGAVNGSTGLYTAGAVSSVTDTLKVTDAFGNTATVDILVV